jgi:hypothetical protein
VHAHHAEIQGMRSREASQAEKGHADRDLHTFGEGADLLTCVGLHDAVAGENHRAFSGANQVGGLVQVPLQDGEHGVRIVRLWLGGIEVEDCGGLLCVFGDVNEDGAGASGLCDLEGMADSRSDVFSVAYQKIMLRDRQRDARDVDFLEGV